MAGNQQTTAPAPGASPVASADVAAVQLTHTGNTVGWVSIYNAEGDCVYAKGPVRYDEAAVEWMQLKRDFPDAQTKIRSTEN